MSAEFLFPRRQTRRDFLWTSGALAAASLTCGGTTARAEEKPVVIGSGKFTYTLDPTWGQLPEGMKYGLGCAVVVDSQDRVYVTDRDNQRIEVFDATGKYLTEWKDTGGVSGMVITKDGKLGGYGGGLWRKQRLLELERSLQVPAEPVQHELIALNLPL